MINRDEEAVKGVIKNIEIALEKKMMEALHNSPERL